MSTVYSVNSQAVNLAGAIEKRPNVLRSTVAGIILDDNPRLEFGKNLVTSYANGSGIRLKRFGNWVEQSGYNDYLDARIPTLITRRVVPVASLSPHIPYIAGTTLPIAISYSITANHAEAEVYIYMYNTDDRGLLNQPWTAEFLYGQNRVRASFTSGLTIEFTPSSYMGDRFVEDKQYLYIYFTLAGSSTRVHRYPKFGGNSYFDSLFPTETETTAFLPFIPIRLDNVAVNATNYPEQHEWNKRAFRKLTGSSKLEKLLADIEAHPDKGEMDYIYLGLGTAVNSVDNAAMEYIYLFWKAAYETGIIQGSLRTTTNRLELNYDIRVSWDMIIRHTGVGLAKPDAKFGELWWTAEFTPEGEQLNRMFWQTSLTEWESLTIYGGNFENVIYPNRASIFISLTTALATVEESHFIVPMSKEILDRMSIVKATQLSTACLYMVVNMRTSRRLSWLQRNLKWILPIFAIVLTVATGGFAAGSLGLLGTNAAVGMAIGLAGAAGVIAGIAANYMAAMLLTRVLLNISVKAFGDTMGAIVASLAAILTGKLVSGVNITQLLSPKNILNITTAGVQAYGKSLQTKLGYVAEDNKKMLIGYQNKMNEVTRKNRELFSANGKIVLAKQTSYETSESFLTRTMLSGSDIVELSLASVNAYVDTALMLPRGRN